MNDSGDRLLAERDPAPVWTENTDGASPFVILCDHAGRHIPRRLADLGVAAADLDRHIACDIGVEPVGRTLARALDAACIGQRYSRLVIDCNRHPGADDSIVRFSDGSDVPGNLGLSAQQIAARENEVFHPYHAAIAGLLDARRDRGQATCLILLHSFTPVWQGAARPWHIGLLYHRDARLAQALFAELALDAQLVVGDNQPYTAADGTDYALARYGERRGLPHVELEIRQDLITDADGQLQWAQRLAGWLPRAWSRLDAADTGSAIAL